MNTFEQIKIEYKYCQARMKETSEKGLTSWTHYYAGYADAIIRFIGIMGYSLDELDKD